MTDTVDILDRAADHLDQVGLHKGDWFDSSGADLDDQLWWTRVPCCAEGAIMAAHGGLVLDLAAHAAIDAVGGVVGVALPRWNDHPARTKADVVDALRKAATTVRGAS